MMRTIAVAVLSVMLLTGCAETFLSEAEQAKMESPAPTPHPFNNTDPRKGEVRLDRHCGFWSCQETTMRCVGPVLILTPADGSTPVRVPDATECKDA